MSAGENSTTHLDPRSFDSVLDDACSRLWDRKVRYTLRRIRELEETLDKTARELDELLSPVENQAPLTTVSRSPAPAGKMPIGDTNT
ncbi:MAG: hypothetical protein LBT39_09135 [Treponema sp.]|nr:hypothetical protein [Treponema sp.]